jgi:ABC-type transporter Mla subunit MlaD
VASLARVTSAAASQAPALKASLRDGERTLSALDTGQGQPLDHTLATLPATTSDLRQGAGASSAVLTQLQALIPRLEPAVAQLAPTLSQVRPLLRQVPGVTQALHPALEQVHTALAGAAGGAAPARAAIRALQPTLDIFQGSLLSALEQPTDLGDPAYLAFLGLFAGGGGASRPFGVNGQGHFMRFGLRFLTGAGLPLPPCSLVQQVSPSAATALAAAGGCTP